MGGAKKGEECGDRAWRQAVETWLLDHRFVERVQSPNCYPIFSRFGLNEAGRYTVRSHDSSTILLIRRKAEQTIVGGRHQKSVHAVSPSAIFFYGH